MIKGSMHELLNLEGLFMKLYPLSNERYYGVYIDKIGVCMS